MSGESKSPSSTGALTPEERIELISHREFQKNVQSHTSYLAKLAAMTGAAALAILGLLGAIIVWIFSENLDAALDSRITAALESNRVEERLKEKVKSAEESVNDAMAIAVRDAVTAKSDIIEDLVNKELIGQAAQNLIDSTNKLVADLPARVKTLEDEFRNIQSKTGLVVLAAVDVSNSKINWSSPGVKYNHDTGIVTFDNSSHVQFVPLITNVVEGAYATETHYVRELSENSFRVWRTPLDTGGRNSPPASFTAVVIGQ